MKSPHVRLKIAERNLKASSVSEDPSLGAKRITISRMSHKKEGATKDYSFLIMGRITDLENKQHNW